MRIQATTLFAILVLTTRAVFGQAYEPLDLAQKIFSKDSLLNINKYIKGEYKKAQRTRLIKRLNDEVYFTGTGGQ